VVGGLAWALVNVQAMPLIADLGGRNRIGFYIGMYYLFTMVGQMLGSPVIGGVMDLFGDGAMFYGAAGAYALGFVLLRRGQKLLPASPEELARRLLANAETYYPGHVSDLLWAAALITAGASALHPSMVELTRPAPRAQDAVGAGRLTVLGIALLATPAALLALADTLTVNVALPVSGSAVLALFVLLRLGNLVHDRERARRELALRGSHQTALSTLAAEALTARAVPDLYDLATDLIIGELDGVQASIADLRPVVDGAVAPAPSPAGRPDRDLGVLLLPIAGSDGPVAELRIAAGDHRPLSDDERDLLVAIANVLASAVQRRQAEDLLRHQALHDALTGLPNRTLLLDRLQRILALRDGGGAAVVFIDLDGFKAVNDTFGHDAGDQLLVTLARRMEEVVRRGDTVARLAGDEFVVVGHPAREVELVELATRLLAAVRLPVDVHAGEVTVGASIGGTLSRPADDDPEALLRRADVAMYAAKAAGGDRIAVADGDGQPIVSPSPDPAPAVSAAGPGSRDGRSG
jgi:diguanylate cyclase (GGDEF)-like protein